MEMKKLLKKYGNSAVIVLTKEDMKVYGWEIGDAVTIGNEQDIEKVVFANVKERVEMEKAIDKRNKKRFEEYKKSVKKAEEKSKVLEAKDKRKWIQKDGYKLKEAVKK